jgi:hypothetical protein
MSVTSTSVSAWGLSNSGKQGLREKYLEHERSIRTTTDGEKLALPMNLVAVLAHWNRGPEIEWNPSFSTYQNRVRMLSNLNLSRPDSLPEGYPDRISSPWVWSGSDIRKDEYVVQFQREDVVEIENALSYFKGIMPLRCSFERHLKKVQNYRAIWGPEI